MPITVERQYTGTLYPYQRDGVANVRKSLALGPTLLVSPTGAGKTDMAAAIAERYRSVLFVAHRRELIEQARRPMGSHVARMSIQRALRHGPATVACLIIDEAHRAKAKTYAALIDKYPSAARLGLTATPLRTDGQSLCDAFSHLVTASSMKDLVASGHLVPYIPYGPPDEALEQLDQLKRLKKRGGDYETSALSQLINTPRLVGRVVDEYLRYANGRRAVVFAVSVAHSKALEAAFLKSNVRAIHIDGRASMKQRDAALARVASGEIDVLCNVNLFTEGWDCPAVSCVIMARPTESLTLYLQCVGRGMRPDAASGKRDVVLLDHAGNMARHGMPDEDREWSLESRAEREKREAETAELERIYALGFDSLEQYRLEEQRRRDHYYRGAEVEAILRPFVKRAFYVLRQFNIPREDVRGRSSERYLYPKVAIDELVAGLRESYSASFCAKALGMRSPALTLRRLGVRSFNHRYVKADVDRVIQLMADNYTSRQIAAFLGQGHKNLPSLLKRHRIPIVLRLRNTVFYSKSAVDHMIAKRTWITPAHHVSLRQRRKVEQ